MRTLLVISTIAVLGAGGPGIALADPGDPDDPQSSGCISTGCKGVYPGGELPPGDTLPGLPDPIICMELVGDDSTPPEDQWDGCILP